MMHSFFCRDSACPAGNCFGVVVRLAVASLALFSLAGCDSRNEKAFRRQEAARQERVRDEHQTATQAKAVSAYLDGRIRLVGERVAALEKRRTEIARDQREFAKLVAAEMAIGKDADAAARHAAYLIDLLKSSEFNALALRYLSTDFTAHSTQLSARIGDAAREVKAYEEAVAKAEALYEASVNETKDWGSTTQKQRDAEIERIQREITQLERRREELRKATGGHARHSLAGGSHVERARSEERTVNTVKISELDDEIDRRREQIDYLRNPDARQRMRYRATDNAFVGRRNAAQLRRTALQGIDQRMKPKRSVSSIVEEFERKTVDALREAMQASMRETEVASRACDEDLRQLRAYALAVPVSDASELREIRDKAALVGERRGR